MNYQQTLDYLFSQLPMFQRIGSAAYKADLNNTIAICDLLNNPQHRFKSVHIAGTNGKGSTSHILASVLQCAGLKVGLYTSPHLKDFRERIKINGKEIPQETVVNFVKKYQTDFESIQPSFFEMTVGLAFDYFAQENIDIAVIETGLGGRLDSTNIIQPILSVITNISYDHTALLGDTLEKIAAEKAGVIKSGISIVIGETQSTKSVFIDHAKKVNAPIYFADAFYKTENLKHVSKGKLLLEMDVFQEGHLIYKDLQCELLGLYQQKNIPTVMKAIEVLNQKGYEITEEQLRKGIANVVKQTGLLGRWQILNENPLTIADTGHNEAGIKEVLKQLQLTLHRQLHFVLGMVNDKDITTILKLLPKEAIYYFCKANIPRALDQTQLAAQAKTEGLKGESFSSVADALTAAQLNAKVDDLVFVGGSTFVVAEVV